MIIDNAMLYCQARHGTRSPTKKRIKQLDDLSAHLEVLVRDAKERHLSSEKVPSWMNGWKSPWQGKLKGGELIRLGEEELYALGIRIRDRFPSLFDDDYHPDIYPIKATQVSSSSFLFLGRYDLWKFLVISTLVVTNSCGRVRKHWYSDPEGKSYARCFEIINEY